MLIDLDLTAIGISLEGSTFTVHKVLNYHFYTIKRWFSLIGSFYVWIIKKTISTYILTYMTCNAIMNILNNTSINNGFV